MPQLTTRGEGGLRCARIEKSSAAGKPLVSIVLAVFNAEDALRTTLESICSQTYSQRELLIVDGGSSDETLDIIGEMEDSVDYWMSEPDRGTYDAFNKGIGLAKGDWLYFIGAGDFFVDETVLERVFTPLPKGKLIYGNVIWGNTGKHYDGRFSKLKLCRRNISQQAIFYHRDLFGKWGGFDIRYGLLADYAFNMKCFGDPNTSPEYKKMDIAYFGLDGISARMSDETFEVDKADLIRGSMGRRYLILLQLHQAQRAVVKRVETLLKS
ncbi:MAG TPA: glycosyltransferase family 2 protein [Syntrophobacteraceae bacterium]|nr:glycosyltransferase family 2 protein [Syntrophobacteraceae bacterium]